MTENNDETIKNVDADSASWEYWKNGKLVASGDITEYVSPEGICEECRRWQILYFDGIAWLCETCFDGTEN